MTVPDWCIGEPTAELNEYFGYPLRSDSELLGDG